MNRRRFIGNFAAALAGFAVLPPATTYGRVWRATRQVPIYHYANCGVYELLKACEMVVEWSEWRDIDNQLTVSYARHPAFGEPWT